MNRSILTLASAALVLSLAACSETTPNAAQSESLTVEGVAATGWALTQAQVMVMDGEGDTVFQGSTDDLGQYVATMEKAGLESPLTIKVKKDSVEFEALVAEVQSQVRIRAHVNPLTDVMSRQLKAELGEQLKQMTKAQVDSMMATRTRALLGADADFAAFASGEGYVAAVQGRPEIQPSMEDVVLHALTEQANAEQRNIREWLIEQEGEQACLLEQNTEFQAQVIALSEGFGVSGESVQGMMGEDMEAIRAEVSTQLEGLNLCERNLVAPVIDVMIRTELALQADPNNEALIAEKALIQTRLELNIQEASSVCADREQNTNPDQPIVPQHPETDPIQPPSDSASGSGNSGSQV